MPINVTWSEPTSSMDNPISTASVGVGIDFGESVNGFTLTDISVSLSSVMITTIDGAEGSQVYTLNFSLPVDVNSSFTITINANTVSSVANPSQTGPTSPSTSEQIYFNVSSVPEFTGEVELIGESGRFSVDQRQPAGLAWDGTDLYMAGREPDTLYTVDRTTGIATRVGDANRFSFGETNARGLAWDGTNLYMVGWNRDALSIVDRTTGIARRVGSVDEFGASERLPEGLAWDGTNLYMVGQTNDALYTVDRTTGIATRVGTIDGFGVNERLPTGLTWDGTNLYMVGTTNDALYTVDRTTGIATRVGTADAFGVGERAPGGLGWNGTNLYMSGSTNDRLYRLDRSTGAAIGESIDLSSITRSPSDLAWDGSDLYMIGHGTSLWRIDLDLMPVEITLIAASGVEDFGIPAADASGLAWDGTNLYMLGNRHLYTLDRTEGIVIKRGITGFGVLENFAHGLAWDGTNLYMKGRRTSSLYTLDRTTGAATRVTSLNRLGTIGGLAWDGNHLYELNTVEEALYRLNRVTGSRTRIGSAENFGINEMRPTGLSWDGTNMYMTGYDTESLSSIDRTTGIATEIGSPNLFGAEEDPRDLAWDGNNLYMLGDSTNALYTVDRITGMANQVGNEDDFGIGQTSPQALAWDGTNMYMIGASPLSLYTISRTTGIATLIATLSASIKGLAWNGTTFYAADSSNLYTLNKVNGVLTRIASIREEGGSNLTRISSLTWGGTNLYAVEPNRDNLFIINTSTARATNITNNDPHYNWGVAEHEVSGIVWDGINMYITGRSTDLLYRLVTRSIPTWSNLPDFTLMQGEKEVIDLDNYVTDAESYALQKTNQVPSWINISGSNLNLQHPGPIIREVEYDIDIDATNTVGTSTDDTVITAEGVYEMWIPIPDQVLESDAANRTISLSDYVTGSSSTTVTKQSGASWATVTGTNPSNYALVLDPPTVSSFTYATVTLRAVDGSNEEDLTVGLTVLPSIAAPVTPIEVEDISIPGLVSSSTFQAIVTFSRALVAGETFLQSDVQVDGISGAVVTSVLPDMDNNRRYIVTISVPEDAEGSLSLRVV